MKGATMDTDETQMKARRVEVCTLISVTACVLLPALHPNWSRLGA